MKLPFVKMQGAGNDFVVLDARSQPIEVTASVASRLADRHFGVGCDQIMLVEPPAVADANVAYRIFNADGSAAQQCGNGARCVAAFVWNQGDAGQDPLRMQSPAGIVTARRETDSVVVEMSVPITEPDQVPFVADGEAQRYSIDVDGSALTIGAVSMGNPHAVLFGNNFSDQDVSELGPLISKHARFPAGANAGFAVAESRTQVRLRVFERGVGETLACGSGACAAVVAGRLQGILDDTVDVELPGGKLGIYWAGAGHPVEMSGPATFVFEGTIHL